MLPLLSSAAGSDAVSSERVNVFRFAPESGPPDLRTTPAASFWRTPPSRPRAARHRKPLNAQTNADPSANNMSGGASACMGICIL